MLIVTKVETVEAPGRTVSEVMGHVLEGKALLEHPGEEAAEYMDLVTENIRGQIFRKTDRNGKIESICIGMTEEAQKVLRLPMEAFENQREQIDDLTRANSAVRDAAKRLREEKTKFLARSEALAMFRDNVINSTWWERLKFLFLGKDMIQ